MLNLIFGKYPFMLKRIISLCHIMLKRIISLCHIMVKRVISLSHIYDVETYHWCMPYYVEIVIFQVLLC